MTDTNNGTANPARKPFDAGPPGGSPQEAPGLAPVPAPLEMMPGVGLAGGMGLQPGLTGIPAVDGHGTFGSRDVADPDNRDERDFAGFRVRATDGWAGRVDKASHRAYNGDMIVDAGPAFFRHKVVVPANAILNVDTHHHVVSVDLTKSEVKGSAAAR